MITDNVADEAIDFADEAKVFFNYRLSQFHYAHIQSIL